MPSVKYDIYQVGIRNVLSQVWWLALGYHTYQRTLEIIYFREISLGAASEKTRCELASWIVTSAVALYSVFQPRNLIINHHGKVVR